LHDNTTSALSVVIEWIPLQYAIITLCHGLTMDRQPRAMVLHFARIATPSLMPNHFVTTRITVVSIIHHDSACISMDDEITPEHKAAYEKHEMERGIWMHDSARALFMYLTEKNRADEYLKSVLLACNLVEEEFGKGAKVYFTMNFYDFMDPHVHVCMDPEPPDLYERCEKLTKEMIKRIPWRGARYVRISV